MRPSAPFLTIAILAASLLAAQGSATEVAPAPGVKATFEMRQQPHPSIHVVGDAEFADPLNGVSRGSGTAADPYVIESLTILRTHTYGILLKDTRAHVVIQDVLIQGAAGGAYADANCATEDLGSCIPSAINLYTAENVTIRRVRVFSETFGILGTTFKNVTIEDSVVGPVTAARIGGMASGLEFIEGRGLTVRNVTVEGSEFPTALSRVHDVRIEGSTFLGSSTPPESRLTIAGPASDVRIERSRFVGVRIDAIQPDIAGLDLVRNEFEGASQAFSARILQTAGPSDVVVCGNAFRNQTGGLGTVELVSVQGLAVRGNEFLDGAFGLFVGGGSDVLVERNAFSGHLSTGLEVTAADAEIHDNAIVGNAVGASLGGDAIDATRNWWGSDTGPSGVPGGGTGDSLVLLGGSVSYDPWRDTPPSLAVDCGAPGPIGSEADGAVRFRLDAKAKADVHRKETLAGGLLTLELDASQTVAVKRGDEIVLP